MENNIKQVAGTGFGGPLLICLLNLTLNEKSSSHSLQFVSKYHVFLDSLRPQIREHKHRNSGPEALYYTGVELEKMQHTHREHTYRESNYRGHSNPVDRRVERANYVKTKKSFLPYHHSFFNLVLSFSHSSSAPTPLPPSPPTRDPLPPPPLLSCSPGSMSLVHFRDVFKSFFWSFLFSIHTQSCQFSSKLICSLITLSFFSEIFCR